MGYPCHHVASVMRTEPSFDGMFKDGFPLTSVQVFWRIEYYHYGMSTNPKHQSIQKTLAKIVANDTTGVPCPVISVQDEYIVPESVLTLLYSPAECRVLNYNDSLSAEALRKLKDKREHQRLEAMADVPAGLSQASYFDDGLDDGAFAYIVSKGDDEEDKNLWSKFHSSEILKNTFYDAAEAINNSNSKEKLEAELMTYLNQITSKARGDCDSNVKRKGKRISMMPPNSKRKKAAGTKNMI